MAKRFSRGGLPACALILVFGALVLAAQQKPAAPTAPAERAQRPAFRATSRLVEVNVLVRDRDGKPVTGLTAGDFQLLDNGMPQTVSVFAESAPGPEPAPSAIAQRDPRRFSNLPESSSHVPSVTILLLDSLNTPGADQQYARARILEFLNFVKPQDRVALYVLGINLVILHDFTGDTYSLLSAVERYKAQQLSLQNASDPNRASLKAEAALDNITMDWASAMGFATAVEFVEVFRSASNVRSDQFAGMRIRTTLAALEAIANRVRSIPGRKNLIWVSGGFPVALGTDRIPRPMDASAPSQQVFTEEIRGAVRALNAANLALYPVDTRGLTTADPMAPPANRTIRGARTTQDDNPFNPITANELMSVDTMVDLAKRTGGKAAYRTNDISNAVREALDDSRFSYTLGFYPQHGRWDGRFRNLAVKVNRPGVQIYHRRGYFADAAEPAVVAKEQIQVILREAALNPLDASGIGLVARADPVAVAEARSVKVAITVPSQGLELMEENGRWTGQFHILTAAIGPAGELLSGEAEEILVDVPSEQMGRLQAGALTITRVMDVPPTAMQARIVIRDARTGRIGSLSIPLQKIFPAGAPSPKTQ